ncbi:MAG: 1-(5-phosphoribosyl)-5-((5-phosphoribosylamino)methylideneamino)imidazole-4-carboxamide isomerase, partial [Chloroflexi bacterium]|nr:1-(5-phosphoribosyl)-5-((5-phosphoribosylamino)methylideneamino)imidazole-4-carboxamide isomerase [Chloroflexota bacterium]
MTTSLNTSCGSAPDAMEIIPAIDLRGGAVVRLLQGNYDRQTTFGDDPVGVARGFEADGAPRIHVVDLDGAREGRRTQAAEVRAVAAAVGIPIELGGGLRSADVIAEAIADGVDRVVLGTAAVEEPELIEQALAAHGAERVVVGIDARDGIASVSGWTESGSVPATDLLDRMVDMGVRRFIYTDITRDGTLTS